MRWRVVIFIILSFACCWTAVARTSLLSPSARFAFEKWQKSKTKDYLPGTSSVPSLPVTIQTKDVAALEAAGVSIGTQAAGWVTAVIPYDKLDAISEISGVTYITAGNMAHPVLDKALSDIGYDAVLNSPVLPMPYTGKGVIVGVVDIGFQWDHAAFRRADGSTRIAVAWNQNDSTGTPPDGYVYGSLFDTEEEILTAHPCVIETHATHVASIAAGSSFEGNPYGGVARDAELVLVDALHTPDGGIYTEGIVDGIKFIRDYASRVGKSCVINLSIGGTVGPHDGTSPFDQMCDSLQGAGCLLVGAMGNMGAYNYHLGYDFDKQSKSFRTGFRQQRMVLPEVDMWSEAPVRFAIEIYGYNEENPRATTGMLSVEEWRDTVLLYEGEEILIEAASAYSKANGLYNTLFSMSGVTDIPGAFFVLAVEGEHGRIDMWNNAPANTFDDFGRDDLLIGDREMSLLEVGGTGRRITSVGAYVTNTSVAVQNGGTYSVDYTLHAVAPFSSRGFTRDGRMKPEVLAPGCIVTAAFNEELASDPENFFYGMTVGEFPFEDRLYYYGANSGTSMASPIVAGVYALWLEACPTLTPEEAKAVLRFVSTTDEYTTDPTAAGYGKINPFAGLCYLLQTGGMENSIATGQTKLYPSVGHGQFTIMPSTDLDDVVIEIYTATGALVYRRYVGCCKAGEPQYISMPFSSRGMYLVRLSSKQSNDVYKYLVNGRS